MVQTVLFQTIQFSKSSQYSSFLPIDWTLSGDTTLSQSGPGSDGNEEVLRIPQSSSITGNSQPDCLVLYPGRSLGCGVLIPPTRSRRCIVQPQSNGQRGIVPYYFYLLHIAFYWSLSDSQIPQFSRTFLSILADGSCAVVWLGLILPLISFFFSSSWGLFQGSRQWLVLLSLLFFSAFSALCPRIGIFLVVRHLLHSLCRLL